MMKKILDFYKKQGVRTEVKKGTYDNFPNNVKKISKIIYGLLIHPATFEFYNLSFSKERINDKYKDSIQKSIDKIMKIENRLLVEYREPKNRVVNTCRQFAMFICSVLREKGIPARCRCGFAIYLENGWFEDHWICEYWNVKEKKWIRIDSEIDDAHISQCHINIKNIDPYNLPKEAFFTAGVFWKLYARIS